MNKWPDSVEDDELRERLVQGVKDAVDQAVIDLERAYNLYHYMRAYIRDCKGGQDWGLFVTRQNHPQNLHGFDYALNMMRLHYPSHAEKLERYMRECGFEPETYPAHVKYWKDPYRIPAKNRSWGDGVPRDRTGWVVDGHLRQEGNELQLAHINKMEGPPKFRLATWWERLTKDVYVKEIG